MQLTTMSPPAICIVGSSEGRNFPEKNFQGDSQSKGTFLCGLRVWIWLNPTSSSKFVSPHDQPVVGVWRES